MLAIGLKFAAAITMAAVTPIDATMSAVRPALKRLTSIVRMSSSGIETGTSPSVGL